MFFSNFWFGTLSPGTRSLQVKSFIKLVCCSCSLMFYGLRTCSLDSSINSSSMLRVDLEFTGFFVRVVIYFQHSSLSVIASGLTNSSFGLDDFTFSGVSLTEAELLMTALRGCFAFVLLDAFWSFSSSSWGFSFSYESGDIEAASIFSESVFFGLPTLRLGLLFAFFGRPRFDLISVFSPYVCAIPTERDFLVGLLTPSSSESSPMIIV